MKAFINWVLVTFRMVKLITHIKCKGILRDIILFLNTGKVTRISKLIEYDLFVINTNKLRYIKYTMARHQNTSGYLVLSFRDRTNVQIEFTDSLLHYAFQSDIYIIDIHSDAYLKFLSIVNSILISRVGNLLKEIDNRHMSDICCHMYDDTIQIKSKMNTFNIKLSQLKFATDDIDTNHDFFIIKNINNIYFVIPIDKLYSLRDNVEDYIFITKSEYINNILEPLKYFSPSSNIIYYNDYRNITRNNSNFSKFQNIG